MVGRPPPIEPGQPTRRQYVKFTFFQADPEWRRIESLERERAKSEFCQAAESFNDRTLVRSYSCAGMRGDVDFLLWQIADALEDIQKLESALFSTGMGAHLSTPHSFLAMTRKSVYVSPEDESQESRLIIKPTDAKYFFVYPFVKTRAWYALSQDERQRMMDEHIAKGRKYPSVKLNTTYSFGLDDQEFVVAFETDEPGDFLDLVMELREAETSAYTLRDTPIFTCIRMPLRETLDSIGAPGDDLRVPLEQSSSERSNGWACVAALADVPEGGSTSVFFEGEQVALFNVDGRIYAMDDRCSHANASLSQGELDDRSVVCPSHGSRFDLASGEPIDGPARRAIRTYAVRIEAGNIYLAPSLTGQASTV
jgi:chlorite dismutase